MKPSYISDLLDQRKTDLPLSREDFIARYFPRYVNEYRPPSGIRTYTSKHTGQFIVQMSSKASVQAQVTKRNNIIDNNYAEYLTLFEANKPFAL